MAVAALGIFLAVWVPARADSGRISPLGVTTEPISFLRTIYRPYAGGNPPVALLPPDQIYDPALLALVTADHDFATAKGKPSLLTTDPICLCQDFTALQITHLDVILQTPTHMRIGVAFADGSRKASETYDLIRFGDRWLVHDIIGGIAPDLVGFLARGLAAEGAKVPTQPIAAPNPAPPPELIVMRECERRVCGIWWLRGAKGAARWGMNIAATLTSTGDNRHWVIERRDLTGGFTASYTASAAADKIVDGQVVWRFPNGVQVRGVWTADVLHVTAEQARVQSDTAYNTAHPADALSWLLIGAELGDVEAEIDAGVAFRDGVGTVPDRTRARTMFLAAAARGDQRADINIAQLYQHALGVPLDGERAKAWYRRAGPTGVALLAEAEANATRRAMVAAQVHDFLDAAIVEMIKEVNACQKSAECRASVAAERERMDQEEIAAEQHDEACLSDPAGCY